MVLLTQSTNRAYLDGKAHLRIFVVSLRGDDVGQSADEAQVLEHELVCGNVRRNDIMVVDVGLLGLRVVSRCPVVFLLVQLIGNISSILNTAEVNTPKEIF